MEYMLLKGTFKPSNPDGDSIHFMPDNPNAPDLLRRLPRRKRYGSPEIKNDGRVKIRYEGIDTLETRYRGSTQGEFAHRATCKNLELLEAPNENNKTQGYILTHLIDTYGRPVAFVFVGDAKENDGTRVKLDVDQIKQSVNFGIIQAGLAYPCFYSTLADNLRRAISAVAIEARDNCLEFWPNDHTESGVTWGGPDSVSELQPIFPKLWRHLKKYSRAKDFKDKANTLDAFIDYLRLQIEAVYIVSQLRFTTLDQIVTINKNTIKMNHDPNDLILI